MLVSGRNLSLIGRSAIPSAGGARASQRLAPEPVESTDPLKDSTTTEFHDLSLRSQRDREVRAHERADATVGRPARPAADDPKESGPDVRRTAIEGEPSDVPAAAILQRQLVERVALPPADPSPQDGAVAAEARVEQRTQRPEGPSMPEMRRSGRSHPALAAYRHAAAQGEVNGVVAGRLDVVA